MATDSKKVLGIALLLAGFLLASANTISVTGFSVLDTDATTYVIVVMLMLFLFMLFSLKEDIRLSFNRRNAAYGLLAFALYIALVSYLRGSLSFVFGTFRIDALLLPLILVSLALTLFGTGGVRRLKPLIIYSIFASPLLLMPLLFQGVAFANANAYVVYDALKLFGAPVSISGFVITSASNASISIAGTCAPLGTFAALVFFLIPVAYFYGGKLRSKVLWVASGVALMLLLNFLRMVVIGLEWLYYGLNQAVGVFHLFAGQLLFYAAIVVMILIARWYGLRIDRIPRHEFSRIRRGFAAMRIGDVIAPAAVIIALGVLALLFTLPYHNAVRTSPVSFYGNPGPLASASALRAAGRALAAVDGNTVSLGASGYGEVFAMNNGSDVNYTTYVIVELNASAIPGRMVTNYSSMLHAHSYILRNGITVTGSVVRSGNLTFVVDYFAVPFNASGSSISVDYEFFRLLSGSAASCGEAAYTSQGLFNYIEEGVYNTLSGRLPDDNYALMCSAYQVAGSTG